MSSVAPDHEGGWDELMSLFREEAGERTQLLEQELLAGSPPKGEVLEALSHEAHALKGTAAVLGLAELAELAGEIEAGLRSAAQGAARPSAEVVGRASAAFREGVDAAARGEDAPPSVAAALAELRDSKLRNSDQETAR